MKTITITAKYEIAETIARYIRRVFRVFGEATVGRKDNESEVVKRLYIDERTP